MRTSIWRKIIFVCVGAGTMLVLYRFAHYKPSVRLKPGVPATLPARPPAKLGQSGMPPCWIFTEPRDGRVADCPVLIPGTGRLDFFVVNLFTGAFLQVATDLYAPARPALAFTRVVRPVDNWARKYHVLVWDLYDVFMYGDTFPYTFAALASPDTAGYRYERISQGTQWYDALYRYADAQTVLYGSEIGWNGNGWTLNLQNGSELLFPEAYGKKLPEQEAPVGLRDRQDGPVRLVRNSNGNLLKVVAEDGYWMRLQRQNDLLTEIRDSRGEVAQYFYDDLDQLQRVVSAQGAAFSYKYDKWGRVTAIYRDGQLFLEDNYDPLGRIINEAFADRSSFRFTYAVDSQGHPQQTTVTDSRGRVVSVRFHGHTYEILPSMARNRNRSTSR